MLFRIADHGVVQADPPDGLRRLGRQLSRLRAVVLLAGSVRANHLRKATGRCSLEMPVADDRRVLDCWREQLVTLAEQAAIQTLPVRVMIDQGSRMRTGVSRHGPVQLRIENDPSEFRGTGGLLSDLAREYNDDDLILVTHASQLLFEPLAELAGALAEAEADVSMICGRQGEPAGLTLLRCGCLREVNAVGFVDLNEQALPAIAKSHDVRVVRYDNPAASSLRTLSGVPRDAAAVPPLAGRGPRRPGDGPAAGRLGENFQHHRAGGGGGPHGGGARLGGAGRGPRGARRGAGAFGRLPRGGGRGGPAGGRPGGGCGRARGFWSIEPLSRCLDRPACDAVAPCRDASERDRRPPAKRA